MSMDADNPKIDPDGMVHCFLTRFASSSSIKLIG